MKILGPHHQPDQNHHHHHPSYSPKKNLLKKNQQPFLPQIVEKTLEFKGERWSLWVDQDFLPLLFEQHSETHSYSIIKESVAEELYAFISQQQQSYIQQITLQAVPFLMAVFLPHPSSAAAASKRRILRLATPQLHYELFIQQHLDLDETSLDQKGKNFLKHVKEILELQEKRKDFPTVIERITQQHQLTDQLREPIGDHQHAQFQLSYQKEMQQLLKAVRSYRAPLFEKITDFGLTLTASFALIRIHLLKFLAVLPSLDHDRQGVEVKRLFLETCRRLIEDSQLAEKNGWRGEKAPLPLLYLSLTSLVQTIAEKLPAGLFAKTIRFSVEQMAKRFIAGSSIETSHQSIKQLRRSGRQATLDQLGELVVAESEADHYTEKVLELIEGLKKHVPTGERNAAGILSAHVSIKMSALTCYFNPLAREETYHYVSPRLKKILLAAKKEQVFIHVDAEHYHYRDLVFEIFQRTLLETPELTNFKDVGIVIQAYLQDAYLHFSEVLELAKKRKLRMPIRLVKGAYWDAETIEARAHGFRAPQFLNKEETDLHFRQLVIQTLQHGQHLQLCLASHNLSDHAFAETYRAHFANLAPVIEHQCLHMTYEALGLGMQKMGWCVRNYIPIGNLLVGMAYLVRRIMENSSQVGILTIMRTDRNRSDFPEPHQVHLERKRRQEVQWDATENNLSAQFFNMTPVRLYLKNDREAFLTSYQQFRETLGAAATTPLNSSTFPLEGPVMTVVDPSQPSRVTGKITFASKQDALKAIDLSEKTYLQGEDWALTSPAYRASLLVRTANLLLIDRLSLAALIMHESGKTVLEALGDVDEAIDFLNFYAREEIALHQTESVESAASAETSPWASRGVVAVIGPWNFPLAIPCGMAAAALVAGNTVLLKSAEQTPLVAQKLVETFHQAGVPAQALIHLPGLGEEVGATLVEDPRVAAIIFTGSKAVGQMIYTKASARVHENRLFNYKAPVKVVTEMGGKNAIIVTANAELDETVAGCLYSAFGHAGQKCSALSRILVEESIYESFRQRFKEAVRDLKVGPVDQFNTLVNPIISKEDQARLKCQSVEVIEEALKLGGSVLVDRSQEPLPGLCVGPVVVEFPYEATQNHNHKETYAQRELFGPVVHLIKIPNREAMVQVFNSTDYALTGGLFTQSQDDMEYYISRLEAGNLYVNRGCTGARVFIEPFGGFKLSGTGPKAGGKDYLKAFHVYRSLQSAAAAEGMAHSAVSLADKNLSLSHTLKLRLEELLSEKEPNRAIPGLVNFNQRSLVRPQGLLITTSTSHLQLSSWRTLEMALALQIPMQVIVVTAAKDPQSLTVWNDFVARTRFQGVSEELFPDALYVAAATAATATHEDPLSQLLEELPAQALVVMDAAEEKSEQLNAMRQVVLKSAEKKLKDQEGHYLPLLLTPFDGEKREETRDYLSSLVFTRSLSINTMRHGAPLSLESDDN